METTLTFPKDLLRLLYWLYFKPLTLRRYVRELDPRLDDRLEVWRVGDSVASSSALADLVRLSWTLLAVGPLATVVLVALPLQVVTPFDWYQSVTVTGIWTITLLAGYWLRWRLRDKRVVVIAVAPVVVVLVVVLGVVMVGLAFEVTSVLESLLAFGQAFGLTIVLALGLVAGLAGGLVFGLAGVLTFGLAFGLASVLAGVFAFGLANTLAFLLPLVLALGVESVRVLKNVVAAGLVFGLGVGLIGSPLFGQVESLAFGLAVGLALIAGYFRLFLYALELPYGYILSRLARDRLDGARHYLHRSPVYWDEVIWFPLLGLDQLLVAVGRHDRQAGAEEITYVAQSFRQGWAARNALVELTALEMEDARDLGAIGRVAGGLDWLPTELPQELEEVLPRIHQVAQRVRGAQESETLYNKALSLQRAREEIGAIRPAWGWNPKGRVAPRLGPVLDRWAKLLAREKAALAEQQAREGLVPNVYVAGNPLVKGSSLFKGRRDLFLALERILAGPTQQRQPLLLYGQRRSGKTSVLHQLPVRLGPDYVPVFVDMQSAANAESASGLLDSLSRAVRDSARDLRRLRLPRLSSEKLAADPYMAFQEWLAEVEEALGSRLILLNLDEYERLEEMLADGRIDRRILNLLRTRTPQHPRVAVLLSGSHTPQDMAAYWSDYLINLRLLHVSYLKEDEARELIEEPVPDFPLAYDEEAVARIVAATRGQPFLVQATCQRLVDLVNKERQQHATPADAEAALEALVTADDTLYWREVWAGRDTDDTQRQVLLALAHDGDGVVTEDALVRRVGPETAEKAVPRLLHRELLEKADGGYRFQVEIMRRWVRRHGQLEKAVL